MNLALLREELIRDEGKRGRSTWLSYTMLSVAGFEPATVP